MTAPDTHAPDINTPDINTPDLAQIIKRWHKTEGIGVVIWLLCAAVLTALLAMRGTQPLKSAFGIWLAVIFCSVPVLCIALETLQRCRLKSLLQDDALHTTEQYSAAEGRAALKRHLTARGVIRFCITVLIAAGLLLMGKWFLCLPLAGIAAILIGCLMPKRFPAPDTPAAEIIRAVQQKSAHRTLFWISLAIGGCAFAALTLGWGYTAYSRCSALRSEAKSFYNAVAVSQNDCADSGMDAALWKLPSVQYGQFGGELISPEMTERLTYYFSDFAKFKNYYYKLIPDADGTVAEVWISKRPITPQTQAQTADEQLEYMKSLFRYKDVAAVFAAAAPNPFPD